MGSEDPERSVSTPSVLFLASDSSAAETVESALSERDVAVTVEYDAGVALDHLESGDAECLLASVGADAVPGGALLDRVGEHDPETPVVLLAAEPDDETAAGLEAMPNADHLAADVDSVSYDRLVDRVRVLVSRYRTSRAQRSERDIVERLEQRIRRTERKITALHGVAMDLNAAERRKAVYEATVEAAEGILDLDICFAFEADGDRFVPMARSSTPTDRELNPVPFEEAGVMAETHRTGESDRAVDMELHALAEPTFGDYRSGISVPIGDVGVFQAVSTRTGAFDEIDLELTELLTAHAGSVLQRLAFEEQLRVERDQYAALYENTSDCIVEAEFVDGEPIIRSVNPAFESVFGYDEREVLGRSIDDVVVGEDRKEQARELTEQVQEGSFVHAEVRRRTTDGYRDFLLRSVPLDDDTLYAVYTDITERKDTERALQRQNERLDTFAGVVSHDLRNPLNVAQGHLEVARERCDDPALETVAEAHARMDALIGEVLSLARQGDAARSPRQVALADVVGACWESVDTGSATLSVRTDARLHADAGQLRQLLENLLGNAVQHGGDDVTVRVGDLEDGFYVADDGPGIPADEREDVFEPGTTSDSEGFGLGLAIVRTIAEAHGWTVTVTEAETGGARFEVYGVERVDE